MENETLAKTTERGVKVLEQVSESIEGALQVANFLLQSKLCPLHFYEKLPDGKPDYSKGKPEALVMVAWHGQKLGWDIMTSMQQVVPVNGLISIKGDGAKSLIFASGKLKANSWIEKEEGSIENGDYRVSITATRSDNGLTLTRSFSVEQAKRAGLWITNDMVNRSDGWKYKQSAWYKYPARMIHYRALGFLSRDLFGDVLQGTYTMEEAMDMPAEQAVVIDQGDGSRVIIPSQSFAESRSEKMTQRVVNKIDQKNQFTSAQTVKEEAQSQEQNEQQVNQKQQASSQGSGLIPPSNINPSLQEGGQDDGQNYNDSASPNKLSIEQMSKMDTEVLLEMVQSDSELSEAVLLVPGKNTNKKLREIIFNYQEGTLDVYLDQFKADNPASGTDTTGAVDVNAEQNNAEQVQAPQSEQNSDLSAGNKYGIEVPGFDKGNEREFATALKIYRALTNITPPLNNERFIEMRSKFPDQLGKYPDRDQFCKYATNDEIHWLLNQN